MIEGKSGSRGAAIMKASRIIFAAILILLSLACNKQNRAVGSEDEDVMSTRGESIDKTMRSDGVRDAGSEKSQSVSPYEISQGLDVYLGQNCSSCHRIGDEGGDIGADLTYIGKRLTPDEIRSRITSPTVGSAMESHSFDFTDETDLEDLVIYLSMLK